MIELLTVSGNIGETMRVHSKKGAKVVVRIPYDELKGLDPLLDRQFIQVRKIAHCCGYTFLSIEVLNRVKTIKDRHVHKVYWHYGTTAEITLSHRQLSIPEDVTWYTSFSLGKKLYILIKG